MIAKESKGMESLAIFAMLIALLAAEFSTASDVEKLLRGAHLTEKQLPKEEIESLARLLRPEIIKDQGVSQKTILQTQKTSKTRVSPGLTSSKNYDKILHKLKNKNQLFLITHQLNAKDFLNLACLNKKYFEIIGGNLENLQRHLNRDFIEDFPIFFDQHFPDEVNAYSVMKYFHMFCFHFGTELSYSPHHVDQMRELGVKIYKTGKSSSVMISSFSWWNIKLINGELLVSLKSRNKFVTIELYNFKFSENITLCWEKDGVFYNYKNEKIKAVLSKISFDFNRKICSPGCVESDDYKAFMCLTPANFPKYIRKYPSLNHPQKDLQN